MAVIVNGLTAPLSADKNEIISAAFKKVSLKRSAVLSADIHKISVDARHRSDIKLAASVYISADEKTEKMLCEKYSFCSHVPEKAVSVDKTGGEPQNGRIIIAGFGPAGMFAALLLAECGYRPIVLERGSAMDRRIEKVTSFWNGGALDENCNVQFGEGGAGTFSDGKLTTRIKDIRCRYVLEKFREMGAPEEIMTKAKPHIGTDILKKVVTNMRQEIIRNGGEVHFGSKVTGIETQNKKITGVIVNNSERIETDQVVLAIGHSARDTFAYLMKEQIPMEAKSFAVGMRVEHSQKLINESMYGTEHGMELPAAPYKLTARTSVDRGVYSFCMCPGGYVVNASSEPGRIAVNGMSYSDRASHNANSAIIVTVTPQDFPGDGPLAGVEFQRQLEEKAYNAGKGKVPVQYYEDFKENRSSEPEENRIKPCIKGQYEYASLRGIFPEECEKAFIEGMEHFDHIIPEFAGKDVILAGVESRTSSPVRIHRNEALQSPGLSGLYPCGEGAGYAGGITSAAMDGMYVAEQIASCYSPIA